MPVFDWFKKKQEARSVYELMWRFGGIVYMNDTPTDYVEEGYRLNSDVYSIVSRIAAKCGEARWVLYKAADMQTAKA